MKQGSLHLVDDQVAIVYPSEKAYGEHKQLGTDLWIAPYSHELRDVLYLNDIAVPNLMSLSTYPGFYDKPRECQKAMAEFDLDYQRYWCTSGMRTGKTAAVLWATEMEMKYCDLKRVLIIAPKSSLIRTWYTSIMGIMPQYSAYYSTEGSSKKTASAILSGKYRILVLNYDQLWRVGSELMRWGPQKIIADEASECNDRKSKRSIALRKLLEGQDHVKFAALTATPLPNKPTDIWSISRFINPDTPASYDMFESSIMTQEHRNSAKLVPQPWAVKVVTELMKPNICFATDDVPDMPEHETINVEVDMGVEQKRMFKELRQEYITEYQRTNLVAQDSGTRLWKLVQIAAGAVKHEDGEVMTCGAGPKIAETKKIIREHGGKTIIWATYHAVQNYISKSLRGFNGCIINGNTKDDEAHAYFDQFQAGELDYMILSPAKFKFALQFDAGLCNVWFHPIHSALTYYQASARIRGIATGETKKTTSFNLYCNAFEKKIYNTVLERIDDQDRVKSGDALFDELDLFSKLILEAQSEV